MTAMDRFETVDLNAFTCALDAGAAHIRVSDELPSLAEQESAGTRASPPLHALSVSSGRSDVVRHGFQRLTAREGTGMSGDSLRHLGRLSARQNGRLDRRICLQPVTPMTAEGSRAAQMGEHAGRWFRAHQRIEPSEKDSETRA
jgi:hypothetical protein